MLDTLFICVLPYVRRLWLERDQQWRDHHYSSIHQVDTLVVYGTVVCDRGQLLTGTSYLSSSRCGFLLFLALSSSLSLTNPLWLWFPSPADPCRSSRALPLVSPCPSLIAPAVFSSLMETSSFQLLDQLLPQPYCQLASRRRRRRPPARALRSFFVIYRSRRKQIIRGSDQFVLMTWCNGFNDVRAAVESSLSPAAAAVGKTAAASLAVLVKMCPSCGHRAQYEQVLRCVSTRARRSWACMHAWWCWASQLALPFHSMSCMHAAIQLADRHDRSMTNKLILYNVVRRARRSRTCRGCRPA